MRVDGGVADRTRGGQPLPPGHGLREPEKVPPDRGVGERQRIAGGGRVVHQRRSERGDTGDRGDGERREKLAQAPARGGERERRAADADENHRVRRPQAKGETDRRTEHGPGTQRPEARVGGRPQPDGHAQRRRQMVHRAAVHRDEKRRHENEQRGETRDALVAARPREQVHGRGQRRGKQRRHQPAGVEAGADREQARVQRRILREPAAVGDGHEERREMRG